MVPDIGARFATENGTAREDICRKAGYACPDNMNVLFEENRVSVYHITLVCRQNVSLVCVPGLVFVCVDEHAGIAFWKCAPYGWARPVFQCFLSSNVERESRKLLPRSALSSGCVVFWRFLSFSGQVSCTSQAGFRKTVSL